MIDADKIFSSPDEFKIVSVEPFQRIDDKGFVTLGFEFTVTPIPPEGGSYDSV